MIRPPCGFCLDQVAPVSHRYLVDRGAFQRNARVVEQRAQTAPAVIRFCKCCLDGGFVTHVAWHDQGILVTCCGLFQCFCAAADKTDFPTGVEKGMGGRLADAAAGAGDDDRFRCV
jgi:hypothetical protein